MHLITLPSRYTYFSFNDGESLRSQVSKGQFVCDIPGDYSLMALESEAVSGEHESARDWRCISIVGQMSFNEIGIAAEITRVLADDEISVLVMSGFKTDYFFVQDAVLAKAQMALADAGHEFIQDENEGI